jgi:FlaA1/EpsC-like NDP-sugar epimerase
MMAHIVKFITQIQNRHFLWIDVLIFLLTPILAGVISLNFVAFQVPIEAPILNSTQLATIGFLSGAALFSLVIKIAGLYAVGFYRHLWRYAGMNEGVQLLGVMAGVTAIEGIVFNAYILQYDPLGAENLSPALPVIDGLLSLILVGAGRFSGRLLEHWVQMRSTVAGPLGDGTLIVGAGSAGVLLAQEMQRTPSLGLYPVGFIDDDPSKHHLQIRGVECYGDRYSIQRAVHEYDVKRIVIAMPASPGNVIRDLAAICQATGIKTFTLPAIHEILDDRVRVDSLRDLQIEDLLRREPIQTDFYRVQALLKGKRVLITGAGGSIGSELCRQILKCQPSHIILVGKGENSIFGIQQELDRLIQKMKQDDTVDLTLLPCVEVCINDIRSRSRLDHTFRMFQPQVVFHAAAHKHVPLMELNSPEAITSNVMGTQNLINCAIDYDIENFVMISTDKAVNPTNVMGASKRVAEMIVLQAAKRHQKPFVVVRFGNVLGSRGSVIPTFQQQIAMGGPITVTHPEICRYFMTIPEAVQLTLQSSVLGRSGEVLMLDMGEPVKIKDLAADVVRLAGLEMGKDIQLQYTGLRPGEKLYEELFIPGETYEPTEHPKVIAVRNASQNISYHLDYRVQQLCYAAENNEASQIRLILEQLVTGYKPDYSVIRSSIVPALGSAPSQPPVVMPIRNALPA